MFAYIPARAGSKRIPKKNVRPLGGLPLIAHVLKALTEVKELAGIAVSTDSDEIAEIAHHYPNVVTLDRRAENLSGDTVGFVDLIERDLPRYTQHFGTANILITTATSALVPAQSYRDAIQRFKQQGDRGLVLSVTPYPTSAFLALTEVSGETVPLFPDQYLLPTRSLGRTYHDSGCYYLLNLDQYRASRPIKTFFDLKPVGHIELAPEIGIDLDDEGDWQRLEKAYAQKYSLNIETLPSR